MTSSFFAEFKIELTTSNTLALDALSSPDVSVSTRISFLVLLIWIRGASWDILLFDILYECYAECN